MLKKLLLSALVVIFLVAGSGGAINDLTNTYRASIGLVSLGTEPWLTALAEQRAQELYPHETNFHHVDLTPRMQGCWELWGDNIGWGTTSFVNASHFVNSWINSSTHLANIAGNFTILGSAMYDAPDGNTYAVQVFVRRCSSPPPPVPSSVPPPPPAPPPQPLPSVTPSNPAATATPKAEIPKSTLPLIRHGHHCGLPTEH